MIFVDNTVFALAFVLVMCLLHCVPPHDPCVLLVTFLSLTSVHDAPAHLTLYLRFRGVISVDVFRPLRTRSNPGWIDRTSFPCGASERYLVLEFSFNINQGCSGVGTRGNGVPTSRF